MRWVVVLSVALALIVSPGAQAAPTNAQFNALKQRVAKLERQRRTLTNQVNLLLGLASCTTFVQGVSQFGGYTGTSTTALDYDNSDVPQIWVQIVDPECVEVTRFGSFRFQRLR